MSDLFASFNPWKIEEISMRQVKAFSAALDVGRPADGSPQQPIFEVAVLYSLILMLRAEIESEDADKQSRQLEMVIARLRAGICSGGARG